MGLRASLLSLAALALGACHTGEPPASVPAAPATLGRALTATAAAIRSKEFWAANQQLAAVATELSAFRSSAKLAPQTAADVERLSHEAEELSAASLEGERLQSAWNGFFTRLSHVLRGEEPGAWPRLRADVPEGFLQAVDEVDAALTSGSRPELCASVDKAAWLLAGWGGSEPKPRRSEELLAAGKKLELGNDCQTIVASEVRQRWSETVAVLASGR